MVHVSSTIWRVRNQPSNSTSCNDNALHLLVRVVGKLHWGLQVTTSSCSIWGCILKGCFERGIFGRAKLRLKGIEDFNLEHWRGHIEEGELPTPVPNPTAQINRALDEPTIGPLRPCLKGGGELRSPVEKWALAASTCTWGEGVSATVVVVLLIACRSQQSSYIERESIIYALSLCHGMPL
jgi:hypothetical protein